MSSSLSRQLRWSELPASVRDALTGKLVGLWGAPNDESAFDSLTEDKQQALLLVLSRMQAKDLWHLVRSIDNLYGEGGVGMSFAAWPLIESTLRGRKDFTRVFANHQDTNGGFYEKGRAQAILHFLFQEGSPRKWYVHFDLYSPVHSFSSAGKHLRYEFVGKTCPDWRMIKQCLKA
ncbi:MAG: hypothetical protein H0T77_07965 [Pyrinomonadaceae bacterium]|nr:hypothetical protein [Pyrinomonadaceae bacterium]